MADREKNIIDIKPVDSDISGHKRILYKLQESEKKFRLLYEESPLGYNPLMKTVSF